MKSKSLCTVLVLTTLALGVSSCSSKPPQDSTSFFCATGSDGIPTTFAQTERGKISVIRWMSEYFSSSGYDPKRRCDHVSYRFQDYQKKGILNFITTGIDTRQEIICVSDANGGPCSGLLFTLVPGESASRVIQGLFDIGRYGLNPLQQSSNSGQIYIDMKAFLENAPVEPEQ